MKSLSLKKLERKTNSEVQSMAYFKLVGDPKKWEDSTQTKTTAKPDRSI